MSDKSWSREWLNTAKDDLRVAEHLLSLYPIPLEIICFHCQQAAEKALKAILTSFDDEPPKTHDLIELCRLCVEKDDKYRSFEDTCAMLTAYGVQTRYPPSMELESQDVDRALNASRTLLQFVGQELCPVESPEMKEPTM